MPVLINQSFWRLKCHVEMEQGRQVKDQEQKKEEDKAKVKDLEQGREEDKAKVKDLEQGREEDKAKVKVAAQGLGRAPLVSANVLTAEKRSHIKQVYHAMKSNAPNVVERW
jgi:DUF917 family protein